MPTATYLERRKELETYFDRTAVDAWARLTTDAPVGRVRATVRQGRDEMRAKLLGWLPADLSGAKILDAGCGTGALAVELASRGAHVIAVDLSPKLVDLARQRYPTQIGNGTVDFRVGDMLRPGREHFDYAISMDSLIHYEARDMMKALSLMAASVEQSILFTFIPRTPLLVAMHFAGQFFPKTDRSPSLRPLGETALRNLIKQEAGLSRTSTGRTGYVARGFYISQAMELVTR